MSKEQTKMKYADYYSALTNLYGAISIKDAVNVISYYEYDIFEEDILLDITKKRPKNASFSFMKYKNTIYIFDTFLFKLLNDENALPNLLLEQKGKKFFLPDTLNDLFELINIDRFLTPYRHKIYSFFYKHKEDKEWANKLVDAVHMFLRFQLPFQNFFLYLKDVHNFSPTAEEKTELLHLFAVQSINYRYPTYKGHTLLELGEKKTKKEIKITFPRSFMPLLEDENFDIEKFKEELMKDKDNTIVIGIFKIIESLPSSNLIKEYEA